MKSSICRSVSFILDVAGFAPLVATNNLSCGVAASANELERERNAYGEQYNEVYKTHSRA